MPPHVGDAVAVERDASAVQFVEAHDQVHERGLACAGRSHDCNCLPRLGDERQIGDQRVLRVVGEGDVLELDPALRIDLDNGNGWIGTLFLGVEQLEDALSGRDA